jgi:hypothetical protein
MSIATTVEQDTIYQYLDGKDLLKSSLVERGQLLQKIEQLVKVHQGTSSPEKVAEFPLIHAQTLLFELSVISEYIDALILEVNGYAERCSEPCIEVIETQCIVRPALQQQY